MIPYLTLECLIFVEIPLKSENMTKFGAVYLVTNKHTHTDKFIL